MLRVVWSQEVGSGQRWWKKLALGSPRGEMGGSLLLARNSIMIFHIPPCYTCFMPSISLQDAGNSGIQALMENLKVLGLKLVNVLFLGLF